jgi:hypothetical protein
MGGELIGEVGLNAPVPYPSYDPSVGDEVRRAKGIGVDVMTGDVTFLLARLNEGIPCGICGATGT